MTTFLSYNPKELADITYPFCFQDNVFTPDELIAVTDYCSSQQLEDGVVIGADGAGTESEVRKSAIKFLSLDANNSWMFDRYASTVASMNDRYYGFDLTGFDAIQYTEYNNTGSKYDSHMDTIIGNSRGPNMVQTRKLSAILLLTDETEYEGGQFHIQTGSPDNPLIVEQKKGRMLVFPSFMIHRVTPIISGVRKSLVAWCVGPKFK